MVQEVDRRLQGRSAVVTGGARGIGDAIARRFVQEGASVVIADIDDEEGKKTADKLAAAEADVVAFSVDVADDRSVAALADFVAGRHGCCDILVNNAGILDMSGIDSMTMEVFHHVCNVNLSGYVRTTKALLPLIRQAGDARRVINIASIMGFRGSPGSLAYSTAKGGVVNLTRALACDLAGDLITVNAIAPGFIDTRMAILPGDGVHEHHTAWFQDIYIKYGRIPLRRPGQPGDVAGPAFFLASDDSRYLTGQLIQVDGGVSATF